MKRFLIACTVASLLVSGGSRALAESPVPAPGDESQLVYVIPIDGMIERALVYVMRRTVAEAVREQAAALVFVMNTPGGQLKATEEIINIIANVEMPTYTLVAPDAISAGAILALATDYIYMTPGSRIGDAMPIMMSPLGGAQDMAPDTKEKIMSYTAALIRSVAQRKGHDDQLAEAMVRPELEYRIGDDLICKEGELLTLTNVEAERVVGEGDARRRLLSRGTVADLDGLLAGIGLSDATIRRTEISTLERIARVIEAFAWLLLAGGLLCIYIEFRTPGIGLPGLAGALLLAVWFWGHHIAGLAGMEEMLIFMVGVMLLLVELLVIPGFGIAGIAGIVLMVTGLVLAMVQNYPGTPVYQIPDVDWMRAGRQMGLALLTAFLGGLAVIRLLPHTSVYRHLVLDTAQRAADGYQVSADVSLAGMAGSAATDLRPSGMALLDGRRVNVVARGAFIAKGTAVRVAEVQGTRVVVEVVRT